MFDALLERMFWENKSKEKIAILTLSIFITIILLIMAYFKSDRVPATSEDYEELYQQLLLIQSDPSEIINNKGSITIYDDKIIYKIENEECKMTGEYNRNYELINHFQEDKSLSIIDMILGILLISEIGFIVSYCSLFIIVFATESFFIGIITLLQKISSKKKFEY